ncbi:hypothetical protein M422DRAFT_255287 [Sphaerobolus stellatus SS14]|uniref:Uncharacterized protein n=1 Tax=Sphaerobolus stellatus (strain SS14) TaxID=990650 RepID=A0A0C9VJ98_SPHS4|nr:hypothetical protein M422DRAFT_255287 [Sphaerobolus stellatus SS14]
MTFIKTIGQPLQRTQPEEQVPSLPPLVMLTTTVYLTLAGLPEPTRTPESYPALQRAPHCTHAEMTEATEPTHGDSSVEMSTAVEASKVEMSEFHINPISSTTPSFHPNPHNVILALL